MRGPFRPGQLTRWPTLFGAILIAVATLPNTAMAQFVCGCGPGNSNAPTNEQVVDAAVGQGAMPNAAMNGIAHFSDIVGNRQGQAGFRGSASPPIGYAEEKPRSARTEAIFSSMAQAAWIPVWNFWAQGYGSRNFVGDTATLPGYSNGAGGVVFGTDRQATAEFLYGIALGYSRTTTTGAALRGTADAYSAALYATWTPGAFMFEGRVGTGYIQSTSARSVPFAGATTTADGSAGAFDFLANIEAGYRYELGAVLVKPYAGLAIQSLTRDGFTETGPFGLIFPRQTFIKSVSTLGVAASTQVQGANGITWAPEVKLAWGHDLRDDTLVTPAIFSGLPYAILAAPPGPDAALVSAALSAAMSDMQSITVSYSGDFRANSQTHLVSAGIRRQW